jgi:hypothetical protein
MVLHQALTPQQFMQARRTEAPPLFRQLPQAGTQKQITILGWRPPGGTAVQLDHSAGPPL